MVSGQPRLRRELVVAHYHRQGLIRTDTLLLLRAAVRHFERVLLVSTNLADRERLRLPAGVETEARDNVGYDFYSYRSGLLRLLEAPAVAPAELYLLNTSFLCLQPERLLQELGSNCAESLAYGLVKSSEAAEHIQSHVLVFRHPLLMSAAFRRWWTQMQPLNQREQVILHYELGLSRFLVQQGLRLAAVLDHVGLSTPELERLSGGALEQLLALNARLNPSHFHWQVLWERFGVIKIELLRSNPYKLDLAPLLSQVARDPALGGLIREALGN